LAVLPSVPEYWRCTPTEHGPSLGKPVSSTTHAVGESAAHSSSASRRRTPRQSHGLAATKWWERLVVHLTQALGHRLDRLAPAVQHQPAQVALPAGALIGAWQRREDVAGEGFKASTDPGQFGCCEASHSQLPLCWDREDRSLTPYPSAADLTESY
jgi:hypothetical protein